MEKETRTGAMWIRKAAAHANNLPVFPFKDSEAARCKVEKGEKGKTAKQLEGKVQQDEQFYQYVPKVFPAARLAEGQSAKEKVEERRLRIVAKTRGKEQEVAVQMRTEDDHNSIDDEVNTWQPSRGIDGKCSVQQLTAQQPKRRKGQGKRHRSSHLIT